MTNDSLAEKRAQDECLREPKAIQTFAELDMPLRGPLRQQVLDNAAMAARQRRTIQGVSERVARTVSDPVVQVLQKSLEERARDRAEQIATRVASNR